MVRLIPYTHRDVHRDELESQQIHPPVYMARQMGDTSNSQPHGAVTGVKHPCKLCHTWRQPMGVQERKGKKPEQTSRN